MTAAPRIEVAPRASTLPVSGGGAEVELAGKQMVEIRLWARRALNGINGRAILSPDKDDVLIAAVFDDKSDTGRLHAAAVDASAPKQ